MPHHRHPVAAQDESLNIGEVECAGLRMAAGSGALVSDLLKQTVEESLASLLWRRLWHRRSYRRPPPNRPPPSPPPNRSPPPPNRPPPDCWKRLLSCAPRCLF